MSACAADFVLARVGESVTVGEARKIVENATQFGTDAICVDLPNVTFSVLLLIGDLIEVLSGPLRDAPDDQLIEINEEE